MFRIGELSRITGLTVKALRFYHERGLIEPAEVDPATGYRFYDRSAVERARAVRELRELGFSIDDIAEILAGAEDEADLVSFLERRARELEARMRADREAAGKIRRIVRREEEARRVMQTERYEIEEKTVEPCWVAGIRMQGRYDESGKAFARLGKKVGRHMSGSCLCLYHDGEYREEGADFEPCMPLARKLDAGEGIDVRELPGERCVTLIHRGPYERLGRAYERVFAYVRERGYTVRLPTREVYLKGPGMIFKGNPEKYLTEIQVPVEG